MAAEVALPFQLIPRLLFRFPSTRFNGQHHCADHRICVLLRA